jgi:hypothetical protein
VLWRKALDDIAHVLILREKLRPKNIMGENETTAKLTIPEHLVVLGRDHCKNTGHITASYPLSTHKLHLVGVCVKRIGKLR